MNASQSHDSSTIKPYITIYKTIQNHPYRFSPGVIHPVATPLRRCGHPLQDSPGEGEGRPAPGHAQLGDARGAQGVDVERGKVGADEQRTWGVIFMVLMC